jgi:hypothetical protein
MIQPQQVSQLKELLNRAGEIFIIYPKKANFDLLAAASSLSLSLGEQGKNVRLFSPKQPVETEGLAGLEKTLTQIGNQNLCISFDYVEEQVEKVSYHIGEETQKFYLTIKPQKGHTPLDSSAIEFFYTGAEVDLIILVGVQELDSLSQLYYGYEDTYRSIPIVSINTHETDFGNLKLDMSHATCLSEGVTKLLLDAGVSLSSDAATNLLAGIEESTNNFQSMSAGALTFEVAARLMERGARRVHRKNSPSFGNVAAVGNGELHSSEQAAGSFSPGKRAVDKRGLSRQLEKNVDKNAKQNSKSYGAQMSKSKKDGVGGLNYQPSDSSSRGG